MLSEQKFRKFQSSVSNRESKLFEERILREFRLAVNAVKSGRQAAPRDSEGQQQMKLELSSQD